MNMTKAGMRSRRSTQNTMIIASHPAREASDMINPIQITQDRPLRVARASRRQPMHRVRHPLPSIRQEQTDTLYEEGHCKYHN